MRVFSARVDAGTIVPDGVTGLVDGERVTVLVDTDKASFTASAQEEQELLEAMAEADRGDLVSASDVLRRLGR